MSKKTNVFVVGSNLAVSNMFVRFGYHVCSEIEDADLVQFIGGADISPSLYGEKPIPELGVVNKFADKRDVKNFLLARKLERPMVGICRGGQLLNVLNGGKLVQDCDGHRKPHKAYCHVLGQEVEVSSTHHQMMKPVEDEAEILMTAAQSTYYKTSGAKDTIHKHSEFGDDVEAVYYRETRSLCYQPHPEYSNPEHYFTYVNKFFNM